MPRESKLSDDARVTLAEAAAEFGVHITSLRRLVKVPPVQVHPVGVREKSSRGGKAPRLYRLGDFRAARAKQLSEAPANKRRYTDNCFG